MRAAIANTLPLAHRRADPLALALGAQILDAPGADALLAQLVAQLRTDPAARREAWLARVRIVLAAQASGRARVASGVRLGSRSEAEARAALLRLVRQGDRAAARALGRLAVECRDLGALRAVREREPPSSPRPFGCCSKQSSSITKGAERGHRAARTRGRHRGGRLGAGAADAMGRRMAAGLACSEPTDWPLVLAELRRAAWSLDRSDARACHRGAGRGARAAAAGGAAR